LIKSPAQRAAKFEHHPVSLGPRAATARAGRIVGLVLTSLTLTACGPEVEFYTDGVRRAEGRVVADASSHARFDGEREVGPWQWWFPNGERRESGSFKDGHRTGEWTQWYPNGQRRSRGTRVFDSATNSSPRDGLWTFWHENGEIRARGIYVLGQREGHWDVSREDGSIDAAESGEYHDDHKLE